MATFAEIPTGAGGCSKLVCAAHGAEVCGTCCSDYAPFNGLQSGSDFRISAPAAARHRVVKDFLKRYHQRPLAEKHPSAQSTAPELGRLSKQASSAAGHFAAKDLVRLVSFAAYAARGRPETHTKYTNLMDAALMNAPDASLRELELLGTENKRRIKKAQKARKKAGKKKLKGVAKAEAGQITYEEHVTRMLALLTRAGCSTFGGFFLELSTKFNAMQDATAQVPLIGRAAELAGDGTIGMDAPMRRVMQAHAEWLEFACKHGESVPMDDVGDWAPAKVVRYLREHDVDPKPMPPFAVLVEVMRAFVKFQEVMMFTLQNLPEGEEGERRGRKAMGIVTEQDTRAEQDKAAAATRSRVVVDPQIGPLDFDSLPRWPPIGAPARCSEVFAVARGMHACAAGIDTANLTSAPLVRNSYDEFLQSVLLIAGTFDDTLPNGSMAGLDALCILKDGTGEDWRRNMALRVLECRVIPEPIQFGGATILVPVLAVEYLNARRGEVGPDEMQKLKVGLRKNTRFKNISATGEEMELMLAVLRQNRSMLPAELLARREEASPRGWRFSVLRPADPAKPGGGLRLCPVCSKPASLRCSQCLLEYYCSASCQKAAWPKHKRACKREKARRTSAAAGAAS